jgi:hypothetical protein
VGVYGHRLRTKRVVGVFVRFSCAAETFADNQFYLTIFIFDYFK